MATNVYAPDGLVGRSSGGTTRQYLFDVQGNVAHAMTSSSAVSMSAAYTAWGQRNYVYPFQAPSQWDDCFGYNARWGYVKDATGLYYCQNRYYDPANGRWLTRDPIGYEGVINLYGYCGGGPVGSTDSSGLQNLYGGDGPAIADPARAGTTGYPRSLGGAGDTWDPPEKTLYGIPLGSIPTESFLARIPPMPVFGRSGFPIYLEDPKCDIVPVTRWGRPGLKPGDWVMKGGKNWWNYLMSGKISSLGGNEPAPYASGETHFVFRGDLNWPENGNGLDSGWLKDRLVNANGIRQTNDRSNEDWVWDSIEHCWSSVGWRKLLVCDWNANEEEA